MVEENVPVSLHGSCKRRILQNYLLLWVDDNVSEANDDCQETLEQLRTVVNEVNVFADSDACVKFLQNVNKEKVFVITNDALGQDLIPQIHSLTQLDTIYILCTDQLRTASWTNEWSKVKNRFTQKGLIYGALKKTAEKCDQDFTPMTFIPLDATTSNTDFRQLNPSFMYTGLFKEIFLAMKHDEQSHRALVSYCVENKAHVSSELLLIDEFQRTYFPDQAIWWYTRPCFTFQMLNRSLRLLEADIIVNMGFFIHDLHRQIEALYKAQITQYHGQHFTVYRGQGLSNADFDLMKSNMGGLISFNSFLSTSTCRDVSFVFADSSADITDTVGVLFVMEIDPAILSAPFASVEDMSWFKGEGEVLFSMHSVFRIDQIKSARMDDRLFEVYLTMTADDDPQLRLLRERLEDEIHGSTGWERVGKLLIRIEQLDKAEELYITLIEQTSIADERAVYNHQLGYIQGRQGNHQKALSYYEKSLDIKQQTLPAHHLALATSYNNIGFTHDSMGDYLKALPFLEKALAIKQQNLPANHPDLATSYNDIGGVYDNMGEYSKALSFYEDALDIQQKTLPANHPDLAISYSNIGLVYDTMGQYTKALPCHEKALDIRQRSLPANHPDLAIAYGNIGLVQAHMGDYANALTCQEKALDIRQRSRPANHPDLALSYNNIGLMYNRMGEFSKALSFLEKNLEMCQHLYPVTHPHLVTGYNNIGLIYNNLGDNTKALLFLEKALDIQQKTYAVDHPDLAISHNNIGLVFYDMEEYSKALSFYEKTLDIQLKCVPLNYPSLSVTYNNIGLTFKKLGYYAKALEFYGKDLAITLETLGTSHPDLAICYNNFGFIYESKGEYSEALSYFQCSLDIRQRSLDPTHRDIQKSLRWVETMKEKLSNTRTENAQSETCM